MSSATSTFQTVTVSVTYSLSIEDLIEFSQYCLEHNPKLRSQHGRSRWIYSFASGCILFILMFLMGADWALSTLLLPLGTFVATFFLYKPLLRSNVKSIVVKTAKINNTKFGEVNMVLNHDHILATSDSGESKVNWSGIQDIVALDRVVYLFMSDLNALIVPKKTFSAHSTFEQFAETARAFKRGAGDQVDNQAENLLPKHSMDTPEEAAQTLLWTMDNLLQWYTPAPKAGRHVFRSQEELAAVWASHGGTPEQMPLVDFAQHMVIALFMEAGTYTTALSISDIRREGATIRVVCGTFSRPWPMTNPASVIKVPRVEGRVVFEESH